MSPQAEPAQQMDAVSWLSPGMASAAAQRRVGTERLTVKRFALKEVRTEWRAKWWCRADLAERWAASQLSRVAYTKQGGISSNGPPMQEPTWNNARWQPCPRFHRLGCATCRGRGDLGSLV